MEHYEVRITEFAQNALDEIRRYLAVTLQAPQAAIHTLSLLRREIKALDTMPFRFPLTLEEPWRSEGVHKMPVRNFLVYYWVDEERKAVQVIHVIYAKRDQKAQLSKVPIE